MAKRFKIITYGGLDGVKFPDLLVKYSSGYVLPLHVKEGQYVPLEILDPLDVKKSLIVGSLGHYIETGAVKVEDDELLKEELKVEVKKVDVINKDEKIQIEPTVEKIEFQQIQAESEKFLTNLSDVKEVNDFFKLSYFQKLKFIKECNDKILLQSVMSKVPPDGKQLLNNLQLKLSQI